MSAQCSLPQALASPPPSFPSVNLCAVPSGSVVSQLHIRGSLHGYPSTEWWPCLTSAGLRPPMTTLSQALCFPALRETYLSASAPPPPHHCLPLLITPSSSSTFCPLLSVSNLPLEGHVCSGQHLLSTLPQPRRPPGPELYVRLFTNLATDSPHSADPGLSPLLAWESVLPPVSPVMTSNHLGSCP